MNRFEQVYHFRHTATVANKFLPLALMYQIYSPVIIRALAKQWNGAPFYVAETTPVEIQQIIHQSSGFSDDEIQTQLNKYWITRAVRVLGAYRHCETPLTDSPKVEKMPRNFLSGKGERALQILQKALFEKRYSNTAAELAIRSTHKFLMDLSFYRSWKLNAEALAKGPFRKGTENEYYIFPTVQLTKGCINHCSHCCVRAGGPLSHMPYPMFWAIYQELNKTYKDYPQIMLGGDTRMFDRFFGDSDSLSYRDSIMGADAGDVVMLMVAKYGNESTFMTRGVTDRASEIALVKVLLHQRVALSFVDTPAENMQRNIKQLQRTLQLIDKLKMRNVLWPINHLHLKSGPSVSDDVFMGFKTAKGFIYRWGRAKRFPKQETVHIPTGVFQFSHIIRPNGDIVKQRGHKLEIETKVAVSMFQKSPVCRPRVRE